MYDTDSLELEGGLLEYAVVAGGTGGGDVVVGAHEAQVHGQQRAAHVGDGKWYTEGIHLAVRLHHIKPDISLAGDTCQILLITIMQSCISLWYCNTGVEEVVAVMAMLEMQAST